MYCKICGATLAPGDVFCKNCGASNTNQTEPKAPEVEPILASEPVQNPTPAEVVQPIPEPTQVPVENQVPETIAIPENPIPEPIEVEEVPVNNNASNEQTPAVSEKKVEEKDSNSEEDKSGKFLVVIGAIVGLLAVAVIGYLIYSSLSQRKENGGTTDLTVVNQITYTVRFANHDLSFTADKLITLGDVLEVKTSKYLAKISYEETPNFSDLTAENIEKTLGENTEYTINEVTSKTYGEASCFETNLTYTSNAKTALLLCKSSDAGYWVVEVGLPDFASHPTSNINSSAVEFISSAKSVTKEENQLKVGRVQVKLEETVTASE